VPQTKISHCPGGEQRKLCHQGVYLAFSCVLVFLLLPVFIGLRCYCGVVLLFCTALHRYVEVVTEGLSDISDISDSVF
jgi:hypothetical protein